MKKFVPALFIVLMTGLIGAKFALADASGTVVAQQQAAADSLRL